MAQIRIIGFTDNAGVKALRAADYRIAGTPVAVVSQDGLHAITAAEKTAWLWPASPRAELEKVVQYHQLLGGSAETLARIIPASFDSVFEHHASITTTLGQVLAQHQREIATLLKQYGQARQFWLRVGWDARRLQLGAAAVETQRRLLRDQLFLQLQGLLQDMIVLENQAGGVVADPHAASPSPVPCLGASTVFQALLLVDSSRQAAFIDKLQAFDQECRGQLEMRLVGPLPACNFARVDVTLPDPRSVREACTMLGITPSRHAALADVKRAYRQRAKTMHPDQGGGAAANKGERQQHEVMVRLTQSYRLLSQLAAQQHKRHSGVQRPGSTPGSTAPPLLRFDRKTLQQTPLLTIQRGITRWDDTIMNRGQ